MLLSGINKLCGEGLSLIVHLRCKVAGWKSMPAATCHVPSMDHPTYLRASAGAILAAFLAGIMVQSIVAM